MLGELNKQVSDFYTPPGNSFPMTLFLQVFAVLNVLYIYIFIVIVAQKITADRCAYIAIIAGMSSSLQT